MRYRDLTGIDYDCEDCIHNDKEWDELPCDTCCHAHSGYEPREQEGEADAIGGYIITKVNGKWECRKGQYYTHSLRDEEHFPVVGNVKINILGYVMGEMLDALERRTDED